MLGDPIEAQALIAVYGGSPSDRRLVRFARSSGTSATPRRRGHGGRNQDGDRDAPRHAARTLHVDEPTTNVDWSGAVSVPAPERPWERDGGPRRAGV